MSASRVRSCVEVVHGAAGWHNIREPTGVRTRAGQSVHLLVRNRIALRPAPPSCSWARDIILCSMVHYGKCYFTYIYRRGRGCASRCSCLSCRVDFLRGFDKVVESGGSIRCRVIPASRVTLAKVVQLHHVKACSSAVAVINRKLIALLVKPLTPVHMVAPKLELAGGRRSESWCLKIFGFCRLEARCVSKAQSLNRHAISLTLREMPRPVSVQ
jgi:hypothetical protein